MRRQRRAAVLSVALGAILVSCRTYPAALINGGSSEMEVRLMRADQSVNSARIPPGAALNLLRPLEELDGVEVQHEGKACLLTRDELIAAAFQRFDRDLVELAPCHD